jgi:hypothetical protein
LYPTDSSDANTHRCDSSQHQDTSSFSFQTEIDALLTRLHRTHEALATIEKDADECIKTRKIHGHPLSFDLFSASVLIGLAADVHRLQKQFDDLEQCHQHRFAEACHAYERLKERTANKP